MRNDTHAKHRITLSTIFAIASLALFFYFPTTLFFDNVVSFIAFIFVVPLLFMSIILHESLTKYFSLPSNILPQLGYGVILGGVLGFLMGIIITSASIATPYINTISPFADNFIAFLLYELFFVLPSVLGSVFFGYVFVRHIYEPYPVAWIIGSAVTTLLFIVNSATPLLILFPLILITALHRFKKDHFLTIVTALFIALLIFDTIIIKSLI